MQRRRLLLVLALVAAVGGWAAFRPERLVVNKTVNESLDGAVASTSDMTMNSPAALVTGKFHNGAHDTFGGATVYRTTDGKRVLRLTEFRTSNGPDVHVYLVAANDVMANDTVKQAGFVDLGSIKGNVGDQNYDLPANVDLAKYRSVTIWCARFGVNFGTAPLLSAS